MEMQTIIDLAISGAMAVLGWFARELWGVVKELRKDLNILEVNLPKEYVLKVDMDQRMKHIEDMFQRIYDKLDNKADK
jgi:tRNA uridine 5-carbamoylmethylation protein Kti12